jgi:PPOX class probable F420-dependent enzyme
MLDLADAKQAHIDARLRHDHIIWLTSVRPDGRPHSVAVWFLWDGTHVLIFSIPGNQKTRNLRHERRVVLALDDTRDGDDVIVIEGEAELVDDPTLATTMPAYADKYTALIADLGWTPASMAQRYAQAIRVTPTRVV